MSKIWEEEIHQAIEARFPVPAHIQACASAIRYDLMHGPCWSLIPNGNIEEFTIDFYASDFEDLEEGAKPEDVICETYSGPVYDALLAYWEALPRELFYDAGCGELLDKLPEPSEEEDDIHELFYESIYTVSIDDIRQALFGKTLAKEFG